MDAGGFYTGSITEDLATGLLIQAAGYKGYAVSEVHASGLSPEDLTSLFKQRERWARGCIQTFRRLRLLRRKDLTRDRRRDYGMALLYWYTPLRRLMFILSPILYFVFGIPVIRCGLLPLICLWLPSVLLYYFALSKLAGDMRTARLSNIYDTILFPALLPGVILETLGIQKKQFSVTAKGKMPAGAGTGEVKRRDKGLIRWSRAVYLVLLGFTLAGSVPPFCCSRFTGKLRLGCGFVLAGSECVSYADGSVFSVRQTGKARIGTDPRRRTDRP